MCETFRPTYLADCSFYLYFSHSNTILYLSSHARPGTTCLAGDRGAAATLFFGKEKHGGKRSTGDPESRDADRAFLFLSPCRNTAI